MTNAEFARTVARITRDAADMAACLAEGMANPNFCAADAADYAAAFLITMQARIAFIKQRLAEKKGSE
jgi:hypothetical protein